MGSTQDSGLHASTEVPDDHRAPAVARAFVRQVLERWRLRDLADRVTLVASELVTNAVRHGLPPVRVSVGRARSVIRLDVSDARHGPIGHHEMPGVDAQGGRGLPIVRGVSDTSGVDQVPGDGKTVYATFDLPDPTA